jgi:hypothetical protein
VPERYQAYYGFYSVTEVRRTIVVIVLAPGLTAPGDGERRLLAALGRLPGIARDASIRALKRGGSALNNLSIDLSRPIERQLGDEVDGAALARADGPHERFECAEGRESGPLCT